MAPVNRNLTKKTLGITSTKMNVPVKYENDVSDLLTQLLLTECSSEDEVKVSKTTEEVEVRSVVSHKINKGNIQFLLNFKDGTKEWVSDDNCDCEELITDYLEKMDVKLKTIYIVCRVSSKNQTGPKHVSLASQETRLKAEASSKYGKGYRVKLYRINASAYKNIPKPLLDIGKCSKKGDIIMIYRVDRLSRNIVKYLSFLENLNDRGVNIFAHDEKLWYRDNRLDFIQAIVDANKESVLIGKRVKASVEHRKTRGDDSLGTVPYGFKLIREPFTNRLRKVKDIVEQAVIARIRKNMENGKSCRLVADLLNSCGNLKRGRQWTANMVRNLNWKYPVDYMKV